MIRAGARELLCTAVQAEVSAFVAEHEHLVDEKSDDRIRFRSSIVPPWLYLKGISTGDSGEAMGTLLKTSRAEDCNSWRNKDLSSRRFVYVWADGVHFTPHLDGDLQCMSVLIGASGRAPLASLTLGNRPTPSPALAAPQIERLTPHGASPAKARKLARRPKRQDRIPSLQRPRDRTGRAR